MRPQLFTRHVLLVATMLLVLPTTTWGKGVQKFIDNVSEDSYFKKVGNFGYVLEGADFKEVSSFDDEPSFDKIFKRRKPSSNTTIVRYSANVKAGTTIDFGIADMSLDGKYEIIRSTTLHRKKTAAYINAVGKAFETNLPSKFRITATEIPKEKSIWLMDERDLDLIYAEPSRQASYSWELDEDVRDASNGVLYVFLYSWMQTTDTKDDPIFDEEVNWRDYTLEAMVILRLNFTDYDMADSDDEEDDEDEDEDEDDDDWEEDNDAWTGSDFWDYGIPIGVGAAILGGGAVVVARNKKKHKGNKNGGTPPDGDSGGGGAAGKGADDKQPDQLEMRIYKEYGNTLNPVRGKYPVQARIVRKPADGGPEVIDAALTAQIAITGDDYLQVTNLHVKDGWMYADVLVPAKDEVPEEGVVTFTLASDGGSYTNHLHFQIEAGKICFKQDNLTLPARYEKTVRLPFIIKGMNDGTAAIKATILDEKNQQTKDYDILTEWSQKDECYYAVIDDKLLDPEADKGIPGNFLSYTISLEATKNKVTIKGFLPIYRYYMGLAMDMDSNVNCFLEEYDPAKHDSVNKKRMPDGKDYCPAQQDCFLKLFDYDEENNKVLVIDPKPLSVKWTVKDIADQGGREKVVSDLMGNEATQMGLDAALAASGVGMGIGSIVSHAHADAFKEYDLPRQRMLEFQKQLDELGLSFQARWNSTGEGYIYYVLRCLKGVLNAPNRFDAEMEITAEHKGRVYTFKRTVHILSQPHRQFDSVDAEMAALKQDEKITKGLWFIEDQVMAAGLSTQFEPLLYFVRLQLDFYDAAYGYDKRNIESIKKVYLNSMKRISDENAVIAKESLACDNLQWYQLEWWTQTAIETREYLHSQSLWVRIPIAVASFGFSEIVFEVPYQMKKYVDEGGETVLGGFTVGAKVAVEAFLWEAAMTLGIGAIGAVGKSAGKGAWRVITRLWATGGKSTKVAMQKGLKVFVGNLKREAGTGLKGWLQKQISWELGAAEKAVISRAKAALDGLKGAAKGSKYYAAEKLARQVAVKNIEDLQTMIEVCRLNPTTENLLMKNQLIMRCQADKQTMMLLKEGERLLVGEELLKNVNFQFMRKNINVTLQKMYAEADELVKKDLLKEARRLRPGMSIDKIRVFKATSSKMDDLLQGKSLTFDRDVTYYWIEAEGTAQETIHYFSQTRTEELYAQHFREVVNARTLQPQIAEFNVTQLTPEAQAALQRLEEKQAAIAQRLYDQTVIEDVLGHPESYGDDLNRIIDEKYFGESLKDPAKVAEAIMHKGTSRFDYADKLWAQAQATDGMLKRELLQAQAVNETMEGCRQIKKVFDLLLARDQYRNLPPKISDELKEAVGLLRPLNGVDYKLSQVEMALAERGYTFRSLNKAVSEAVKVVV